MQRLETEMRAAREESESTSSRLSAYGGLRQNAVSQRAETPLGLQAVPCPNELCREPAPRFVPV